MKRQVVGVTVQRLERREVGWKTHDDQLKELTGLVEVLEPVGSQVPLLYELGALPSGVAYPAGMPACFSPAWTNVYDDRDLLAYPGAGLFGQRCRDIRVDTKAPFPTAHSAYWTLDDLYLRLAAVFKGEGL